MMLKGKAVVSKFPRMFAQHHGERPDAAGPHHVGERPRLGAALQFALVHRAELVHVVGLIGAAAGVVEAHQRGDQQRRLVMRHAVRPGEHRAGLAMEAFAVGKEQRVLGRELLTNLAALADKAPGQDRSPGDFRALGNDEALRFHVGADRGTRIGSAEDGAVDQRRRPVDNRGRADVHVHDFLDIPHAGPGARLAAVRLDLFGVGPNQGLEPVDQLRPIALKTHQVRKLAGEFVEEHDLPAAAFVEHLDRDAVAEGRARPSFHQADVFQTNAVADVVVGQVNADVGDPHVVADGAVGQRGVEQAGRFRHGAARHAAVEGTEANLAEELDVPHPAGVEAVADLEGRPLAGLGGTALAG